MDLTTNELINLSLNDLRSWFTTNNKSGYKTRKSWLEKNHKELFDKIDKITAKTFIEKISIYLLGLKEYPKCIECGSESSFLGSVRRGFSKFCSNKCSNKSEITNNKRRLNYTDDFKRRITENREKTLISRYGVDNPMKIKEVRNKLVETNVEKYGVNCVFKSEEIKEKIKETNVKKYGVDHLSKIEDYHKGKTLNMIETVNKNTIKKISKKLSINIDDIEMCDDQIKIKNYCNKHKKFTIIKNNYYSRLRGGINLCTECNPISSCSSISEIDLKEFIEDVLGYELNKIFINNKEIDIHIPEYKLGIEYDGLYWHSNKYVDNDFHLMKTEICEENEIELLHVFEDEWLFKREIIKSIIKSKLNVYDREINTHDCEVKEIKDNDLIKNFLEKNHIHGYVKSSHNIGLFYNDELISLITFDEKNNKEFEIIRFCDKLNIKTIRGINNLLIFFIKKHNPREITINVDRRFSNGNIYKLLGFEMTGYSEPDYWFVKRGKLIRYKEPNFNKSEKNDYRIYDCGTINFRLQL